MVYEGVKICAEQGYIIKIALFSIAANMAQRQTDRQQNKKFEIQLKVGVASASNKIQM